MTTHGYCPDCKKHNLLIPLHDENGGRELCLICAGKWQAKQARKRRWGRIIIRAIKAYIDVGGSSWDISKLKDSAIFDGVDCFDINEKSDPLGYMADYTADEADELTSELLTDAIRLAHPDCHPPERQELAHRVTQELLALKPFVFPKPAVQPVAPMQGPRVTAPSHDSVKPLKSRYPCKECASTFPYYYCASCKAEYDKRRIEENERRRKKQRDQYARRKQRRAWRIQPPACASCGKLFKGKRKDAQFCSNTCRQRHHRQRAGNIETTLAQAPERDHPPC